MWEGERRPVRRRSPGTRWVTVVPSQAERSSRILEAAREGFPLSDYFTSLEGRPRGKLRPTRKRKLQAVRAPVPLGVRPLHALCCLLPRSGGAVPGGRRKVAAAGGIWKQQQIPRWGKSSPGLLSRAAGRGRGTRG